MPLGQLGPDGVVQVRPAEAGGEQPVPDLPPFERVQVDRQGIVDLVRGVAGEPSQPFAQEGLDRVLHEANQRIELYHLTAERREAPRQEGPGGSTRRRQSDGTVEADGIEAPGPIPVGVRPEVAADQTTATGVAPTPSARRGCRRRRSARFDQRRRGARRWARRGTLPVGALVATAEGDDQVVGRGQHRIEEQLAVFAPSVTVADVRVIGEERRRRPGGCGGGRRRRRDRGGRPPGVGPIASEPGCRP